MFTVTKQFHFSASHIIVGVPAEHPCGRLHGHNYIVELVLSAETLDPIGFVVDYNDLKPFQALIDRELDHRHLNDVLPGSTSAEALAYYLFQKARPLWPQLVAVRVSETPKTWAEYRPG
ncbi:MAG: 6-pyruvoyl trahydropterin synthase family protein [Cyanobacteriota bacterium]|jgi:6-pyruvoyltetrahydropterin/6-carboxytetrahydropterin synthase